MSQKIIKLHISSMSCVNCSNGIEKAINKLKGVKYSKVSFALGDGEFAINPDIIDKNTLINTITSLGYGAEENIQDLKEQNIKNYQSLKQSFLLSVLLTLGIIYFMFFPLGSENINQYIIFVLASVVQFYVGSVFYTLSYKAISHNNYDMNVLVALGTSSAYFYSSFVVFFPLLFPEHLRFLYFEGASVIITFILLGRLLEEKSRAKATGFLKTIIDLAPLNANLILEDGNIKEILASDIQLKDKILIKTGEKISADGVIIKGSGDIDMSMISGESMPIYKTIGDEVIMGSLNTTGVIEVLVTKYPKDTTLAKIINLLSSAQSKKLPISRFADKVANIFVPMVIAISILTFLVWHFIIGDTLMAILSSISVLIISCPCALGLATPIAIVNTVGKGAKEGIFIKNPEILEIIKDIKYGVFDKTGTLTNGKISIKDSIYEEKYLNLLASMEKMSEHPISKAIVKFAKDKNLSLDTSFEDIKIIAGKGISANHINQKVLIGSYSFLKENDIIVDDKYLKFYNQSLNNGNSVILASIDKICIGVFALQDTIKDNAKEVITKLKQKNIIPILLTGDNLITANIVAKELNIDKVFAQVLPNEKYKIIQELQQKEKVLFIGDGINDSPAIKQADIGITLNSGSDIAKDASDIILMDNDLEAVNKSINLSIESMTIIKQNLFWAFIYNALGIPLASGILYPFFGIMLSPLYAGIAMSFSSVIVILNSLRLKVRNK